MAPASKPKTCNICGATSGTNGSPFVWRQIAPKLWRLYEADGAGNPTQMHGCHAKMPNHAATMANRAASAPTSTSTPAPAPSVPTGATIDPVATAEAKRQADDLAAIYDELDRFDKEQARREPAHEAIAQAYAEVITDRSGAFVPAIDVDYLIDRAHLEAIDAVIDLADATGIPQNIGLHGPAGSGKTTLGLQIGALRNAATFIVEAAAKQTADEWYGEATGIDKVTGAVTFRASRFVEAIETPNAVCVINDVALLQSRTVQNGLNELLDPTTRSTFVEQLGRTVRVARGVIIVGTWNVGAEYTGASTLSAQLLSRFRSGSMFEVGFPTNGALVHILRKRTGINEPNARRLSNLADWLHNDPDPIDVDTRGLIAAAHLIVKGRPIGHAIAFTLFGELDSAERARAFGIIDVQLSEDNADEAERALWRTPKSGEYVALGDVRRVSALEPTTDEEPQAESESGS